MIEVLAAGIAGVLFGLVLFAVGLKLAAWAIATVVVVDVSNFVSGTIDAVLVEERLEDAKSNHARTEGTWTPRERRLDAAGRDLARREWPKYNHAGAEGVELLKPLHLDECAVPSGVVG